MNLNINEYFEQQRNFSGNVLVAKREQIIFHKSYGSSDKRNKIPNALQTKFMIGSITKSVTALCIMQLAEKGMLSVQQNIKEYLPDLYKDHGITIYHLLTQTSGIRNYITLGSEINGNKYDTPDEILQTVKGFKLKFQAGRKWSYSNTNYLILAKIIELVTGMSYHQYVKNYIFTPAKMKHSGFILDVYEARDTTYRNLGRGFTLNPFLYYGSGDMVSTTEDLFLLDQAICNGTLLKKQLVMEMQEPHYDGKYVKYGYGLFIKNHFGEKSICHSGSLPYGYVSHFEKYLEENLFILVLSNDIVKYELFSLKGAGATYISREIASHMYGKQLGVLQKIF